MISSSDSRAPRDSSAQPEDWPAGAPAIIGMHPSMAQLRAQVAKVARSKVGIILVYGETGTGKGVVARALHALSDRAQHEFTEINCAAIPGSLLESELFGHERGAFTGAVERKTGLLEVASAGTVFLDEVRELDPVMQAKILTLLDTRRFRRLGAVKESGTSARFIAATNKILLREVQEGRFRDDLYYRLQVVSINIPPLRDRGDDVFVLAEQFLRRFNALHGSRFHSMTPEVRELFRRYQWPGNVRELSNLLERICILEEGDCIREAHLPLRIVREVEKAKAISTGQGASLPSDMASLPMARQAGLAQDLSGMAQPSGSPGRTGGYAEQTEHFQRSLIAQALADCQGSIGKAAERLKLSRHALRHQMRKLGAVDTPEAAGRGDGT
ncbi:sigma-54 interaction domain-containing protein [Paracandidimonas soli]|uniref:DNA-binding NtrC family response regulator n=2 Tax=Paracandidimonas soli TaxID=1917182 RepID=A0A4R3USU9_9BURK|nr:DNA-binding NtrC family response regulator [Paracandidimonas soli]